MTTESTIAPTTFAVTLQPSGWRFSAGDDVSLLISAARAAIRLPAACRNGTCRNCLCQVVGAGSVVYPADVRPGLTPDERADGWILPCVARPASDLALAVPGATPREPLPVSTPPAGARR